MDFFNVSFASILSMLALGNVVGDEPKTEPQIAKISTYNLPAIYGQWQLQLDKTDPNQPNCHERYNFGRDEVFVVQSGGEKTYGKYLYSDTGNGLPAIALQTKYDNNLTDCSGNQIDQTGDIMVSYVKYQGDIMYLCYDSEGKECSMKLHRILP